MRSPHSVGTSVPAEYSFLKHDYSPESRRRHRDDVHQSGHLPRRDAMTPASRLSSQSTPHHHNTRTRTFFFLSSTSQQAAKRGIKIITLG
jgi:hypothetical protein